MTTSAEDRRPLARTSGTLMLVGAGKMGSAMLDAWLRLGLNPKQIVAIEPQPTTEVAALAAHGLRLNPKPDDVRDVTVIVIAVKPQIAAEAVPPLAPLV